jgi:pimeloyl-ACP methyl ester carboxylesterase
MYFDKTSNTLAIAGTHSIEDVVTDLTIPFGNMLNTTPRYQAALQKWNELGRPNVVGHSLGGSIVTHLLASNPGWKGRARIYGAPRVSWTESDGRLHSFRHRLDPVSMFDRAADANIRLKNPHSYEGF